MAKPSSCRSPGVRRLAIFSAALLSCTTVRTPVSIIDPTVTISEGGAEPQLELWVESDRNLTPAQEEQFRAEARSALEKALAGRLQPEGGDEVVVIRAQGVTRTPGRRHDQAAATAGMVVGAVVIVAAVVVALVAGGKSGSHGSSGVRPPSASRPSSGMARPAGHASAGAVRPPRFSSVPTPRPAVSPRSMPVPRGFPAVPPHRHGGPAVDVAVGFWWMIPVGPEEPPYAYPPLPPLAPPLEPPEEGGGWDEPAVPPPNRIALEPPPFFPVEERGFFDGDRLVLEATVIDRTTGEALWVKRVSRKADPRDARAVKSAVDALLAEGGWSPPAS